MPSPSFEVVQQFVAESTGHPPTKIEPNSTLLGDLGIDGEDGRELLVSFGETFNVDMSPFEPSKHFGPEAFFPWTPLYWLVLWMRSGTPEQKARLAPITITHLVRAASEGAWPTNFESQRV